MMNQNQQSLDVQQDFSERKVKYKMNKLYVIVSNNATPNRSDMENEIISV